MQMLDEGDQDLLAGFPGAGVAVEQRDVLGQVQGVPDLLLGVRRSADGGR
ncbi:hypothetical protein ACWF62_20705 [Rhodococcus sp. NPDC054953]